MEGQTNGRKRGRGVRATFCDSPLATPVQPIHILATQFQSFLHLPDPTPLYAVLGAFAANMLATPPVWLMLVGPASSGKTELLMSVTGMGGVKTASTVTGPSGLLSALDEKKRKGGSGGLLKAVGKRGAVIFKDFTSILSTRQEVMKELMAAFREIYDGRYERWHGSGSDVVAWEGKLALLAGCTPEIDKYAEMTREMGERWLYYRMPEVDDQQVAHRSLQEGDDEEGRRVLINQTAAVLESLDLTFANPPQKPRSLGYDEEERLEGMAVFTCHARAPVSRNNYTKEIESIPIAESPSRIIKQLRSLYLGCELLGLGEKERWGLVRKVAMDCLPEMRRRILAVVLREGFIQTGKAQAVTQYPWTSRVIEDLVAHRVLRPEGQGVDRVYVMTGMMRSEWQRGWGVRETFDV